MYPLRLHFLTTLATLFHNVCLTKIKKKNIFYRMQVDQIPLPFLDAAVNYILPNFRLGMVMRWDSVRSLR